MQRIRAFFYVSAGVFLLALAFHLGARSAAAQSPGNPIVAAYSGFAVAANGDVYSNPSTQGESWTWVGNIFGGLPIPVEHSSFGQVKARYR